MPMVEGSPLYLAPYVVVSECLCEEFAPLERRFVIDGAVLIRSWRVTVLFCDSQSWSDAQLV